MDLFGSYLIKEFKENGYSVIACDINKKDKFEMEGLDFSKSGQMFIVTNEENKREIYKVKFLYLYLGTNKISDNFTPLKSISSN